MRLTTVLVGILAVLLPVFGTEALLRLTNKGYPQPEWFFDASLLVNVPIFLPARDGQSLETNPLFVRADNAPQRFKRHKTKGVLRVFCVGGSTTAGWPFHHRVGYPQWLALFLKDVLQGTPVEVINAGLHGFDSTMPFSLGLDAARAKPSLALTSVSIVATPPPW